MLRLGYVEIHLTDLSMKWHSKLKVLLIANANCVFDVFVQILVGLKNDGQEGQIIFYSSMKKNWVNKNF